MAHAKFFYDEHKSMWPSDLNRLDEAVADIGYDRCVGFFATVDTKFLDRAIYKLNEFDVEWLSKEHDLLGLFDKGYRVYRYTSHSMCAIDCPLMGLIKINHNSGRVYLFDSENNKWYSTAEKIQYLRILKSEV